MDELLISLHVLTAANSPKTMQVMGTFHGKLVHVLIDGEATHNFVHPNLIKDYK